MPRHDQNVSRAFPVCCFLLILAIEFWALAAQDPDFDFLDVFRPMTIVIAAVGLVAVYFYRLESRLLRWGPLFVAASLLALEITTSFSTGESDRIIRVNDPVLRYHYRPGHNIGRGEQVERINHLGIWDDEYEIPKPADVFRIVFLGGSLGNDPSIQAHYHRLVRKQLSGNLQGKTLETINVSCEGYNTVQQVRLLEKIGLKYEPDLVVVAYQITDPFRQNGAGRQVGNSRFIVRLLLLANHFAGRSFCQLLDGTYEPFGFESTVRLPLERLELLSRLHGFETLLAVMPVMEEFDDPHCGRLYDQVIQTGKEVGLPTLNVVDDFRGLPLERFRKEAINEATHPRQEGHDLIAQALATQINRQYGLPSSRDNAAPTKQNKSKNQSWVPGGEFLRANHARCPTEEFPATIDGYYLDVHEVTVGRFREFPRGRGRHGRVATAAGNRSASENSGKRLEKFVERRPGREHGQDQDRSPLSRERRHLHTGTR